MQCGSLRPTAAPTVAPTVSDPTVSPTISPTFTGQSYSPTSSPTECHEFGPITCDATVTGNTMENALCGNNIAGSSVPDHRYQITVNGSEVREFCVAGATVRLFRGDRTAVLSDANEVTATADQSVNGCGTGETSHKFVVEAGPYSVVVESGGSESAKRM